MGDSAEPTPTPTVKATKTKGGTTARRGTRKYTVKSGDTLSGIADRFDTSISALEELNPDLSASTLAVGDKIVVPDPVAGGAPGAPSSLRRHASISQHLSTHAPPHVRGVTRFPRRTSPRPDSFDGGETGSPRSGELEYKSVA